MRWIFTPAGVVRADGPMLGVRGGVPLAGRHGRGRGGRRVRLVVQDICHHRGGDSCACRTGSDAALLYHQAPHVRHPRVGVRDGGAGAGGAAVHRGAGGRARPVGLGLRHLPLFPRGPAVLCVHGVLHPVREQLLPDAEERRGHGGPAQVRLLSYPPGTTDSSGQTGGIVTNDVVLFFYEDFVARSVCVVHSCRHCWFI